MQKEITTHFLEHPNVEALPSLSLSNTCSLAEVLYVVKNSQGCALR